MNYNSILDEVIQNLDKAKFEVKKDYYTESYIKVDVNNITLYCHIDNNYIHGSISDDDFKLSGYITIFKDNERIVCTANKDVVNTIDNYIKIK